MQVPTMDHMERPGDTEGGIGWAYKVRPLFFINFLLLTSIQQSWRCAVRASPPSLNLSCQTPKCALVRCVLVSNASPSLPLMLDTSPSSSPHLEHQKHAPDVVSDASAPPPLLSNTSPPLPLMPNTKTCQTRACFGVQCVPLSFPSSRTPQTHPCGCVSQGCVCGVQHVPSPPTRWWVLSELAVKSY